MKSVFFKIGRKVLIKRRDIKLTLLGWITISFFLIGIILYMYIQFFTELTVQGKVWFIWGITAWGIVCIFLVVWSFFDYYQ